MKLSDAEWTVMNALWERYPASARDVLERCESQTSWAYTTVKTLLTRLVEKGALAERKRSNTSLYEPLVTRSEARRSALRSLLDKAFDGAFGSLLQHMVADEQLSGRDRRELATLFDALEAQRAGSASNRGRKKWSLALQPVLELWSAHAAETSVQFAFFALVLVLLEPLLARFVSADLRSALWLGVLAKLLLPNAFPAAMRWSIPAAIVPAALEDSLLGVSAKGSAAAWLLPTFGLWLAGVVVFSATAAARYGSLRRGSLRSSEPAPRSVRSLASAAAGRLGLVRAAPVRSFRGPGGPVVLGFLRPVVLIPHSLLSVDHRGELELVLLHELAHVKRRDPLWSLLCIAVQVLHWFHPLVWLARKRLVVLRELACDQSVVRALGGETADYRRALLTLARPWSLHTPDGGLAFLARHSQLALRVRSLERGVQQRTPLRRAGPAVAFALLWAACLPRLPLIDTPFPYSIPQLEDLEGCLRLRFAVQSIAHHAATVEGSEFAPLLSLSPNDDPSEATRQ